MGSLAVSSYIDNVLSSDVKWEQTTGHGSDQHRYCSPLIFAILYHINFLLCGRVTKWCRPSVRAVSSQQKVVETSTLVWIFPLKHFDIPIFELKCHRWSHTDAKFLQLPLSHNGKNPASGSSAKSNSTCPKIHQKVDNLSSYPANRQTKVKT